MQTKPLLYGIIGFLLGGLLVAVAATSFEKDTTGHGTTNHGMVGSLEGKTGDDFDKAFIDGMIEHHQGAIDMAELAKKNAKHREIKDMADDIITAQSKEIDVMRQWQHAWGYATEHASKAGF